MTQTKSRNRGKGKKSVLSIIELHWDYNYYQPWTDNKWIVEEIMTIRDEKDKDNTIDDVSVHQG